MSAKASDLTGGLHGGDPVGASRAADLERSAVSIRDLRKRYGDTIALDGLTLDARGGEILGVAGPNGSGKSTLIRILVGEAEADSGHVVVDGVLWTQAVARGVAVVHQEPQLFPNLTVAQNLMVGRESSWWRAPRAGNHERALARSLSLEDAMAREVGSVALAMQQRTEIARALARNARVFLFDEPNSALTDEESRDLFARMHDLAQAGRVVMLVSHRLAELVAHCQRVAILHDGRCTNVLEGSQLTQDALARELVAGRSVREERTRSRGRPGTVSRSLVLDSWAHAWGAFSPVDWKADAGEVVAIVGVEGSGAREFVRSLAGFEPCTGRREIRSDGQPTQAVSSSYVPAERARSLFSNFSIRHNLVSRLGTRITRVLGALSRAVVNEVSDRARIEFGIKASGLDLPIGSLSGGNQQKVAIASAILVGDPVLALEEPTRGVDIGSKRDIYGIIRAYADAGNVVVLYCTEVPEVFELADRAYVMSSRQLSRALTVQSFSDVRSLAAAITRCERGTGLPAAGTRS